MGSRRLVWARNTMFDSMNEAMTQTRPLKEVLVATLVERETWEYNTFYRYWDLYLSR